MRKHPGARQPLEKEVIAMSIMACPVDDCTKDVKRGGYCYSHYMKNWRYGTPTPIHAPKWEDLRGKRFGTLTVSRRVDGKWLCTCDCGETRVAGTGELNRTGSNNTCGVTGRHFRKGSGYSAAHMRLRERRGTPRSYACADCGDPAAQWSYDHGCPDESTSIVSGYEIAFSPHLDRYDPRCIPCHKRFDLDRINAYK